MAVTQKQILEWDKTLPKFKRGCGDGLTVRKYESIKNGGIYFKGVYRSRLTGKQRECHIGKFGKSAGELSLADAKRVWNDVKNWAITNEDEPVNYFRKKRQETNDTKTFGEAVDGFLQLKTNKIKETTLREYRLKLNNQVMSVIPADTSLKRLEWNNGGRRIVMDGIKEIASDGKKVDLAIRCQNLLRQVFNFAISSGYMSEGRNPADKMKGDESPEASISHHPTIGWNQVPNLLKAVELNRSNSHIQSVLATKLLLMTFLRAGSLTRLEWSWFDTDFPDTITIPGSTSGLKRKKGKNDNIPHHVPVTPQMEKLFSHLKELNGDTKYVFQPLRQSQFPHLDPSAPNNYLRSIGYKDVLRAHGWRSTALTVGIDVLGCDSDVIRKQMGHLPEGKVNQAYDKSLRLKERCDFMHQWCQLLEDSGLKT